MPEYSIKESVISSFNAQEPWPNDVKLFQPYEVEQILLPDNASCLAVQSFLKMCNLSFEVEMRWNAEFMSPSGRVPFIKCGAFVVSELEPIVQFAANKGVSLCTKLSTEEKAEMRAYMSLITNVLVNAELYISWVDEETYNTVTKVRNSSVYPWPLGMIQSMCKRNTVIKRMRALHWGEKTLQQVLHDVEQCCNSLSQKLGDRDFFFGTPTPLDALLFGHMRALLSANGPKTSLMIKPITSPLLRHMVRMANLTKMTLTSQEEYLLTQAFQICSRHLSAPGRDISDKSPRIMKSKVLIKKSSKDNESYSAKDMFGFKPFASKKIIILSSEKDGITCECNDNKNLHNLVDPEIYNYTASIIQELFEKAVESTDQNNSDKNDFEIIVHPHETNNLDFSNMDTKFNDYLDTIEEVDYTNTTVSGMDDVLIITDDDEALDDIGFIDSDHLPDAVDVVKVDDRYLDSSGSRACVNNDSNDTYGVNSEEKTSVRHATDSTKSLASAESDSTLKISNIEEISVERLLKYLRKKNALYENEDGCALNVADMC